MSNDRDTLVTTSFEITVRKLKLSSITQPAAITGVTNGADKTVTALGLPTTIEIFISTNR